MIEIQERDNLRLLTMTHGRANAMDVELLGALAEAFDPADARPTVLTGQGKIFSAGVDLKRVVAEDAAYGVAIVQALDTAFMRMFSYPAPLVCAINGHAIAGGCVAAMTGDYRVLVDDGARVGIPELKVGVPLPVVAMEIMRFVSPRQVRQRLFYRGETLPPEDALAQGLVDELGPAGDALIDRACSVASDLARIPAESFRLTKAMLRAESIAEVDRQLDAHGAAIEAVWQSPETPAAIRRYLAATLK